MECQRNLLNDASNQPHNFRTRNWVEINSTNVANQVSTFKITKTNLYVSVVTLSTQYIAKLLPQLKSGFKGIIGWNKYLAKPHLLARNRNLNRFIKPNFQGVNRIFVLAFENDDQRISSKGYYIPNVEIKDYNVMIDVKIFLDLPVKKWQSNVQKY